jgi:uncharacterized spore protein YtfJ
MDKSDQNKGELGLESILTSLFEKIKDVVRSETIVGKPIEVGSSHIIPLLKLKIGFMAGSRSSNELGASGGAISVEPIGILVVSKDGGAIFYSTAKPQSSLIEKAISLIPEIAEKVLPEVKQRTIKKREREEEEKIEEQK